MKIWMSGEIQSDAAQNYGTARKKIEAAFNKNLAEREFGHGLVELAYIGIIRNVDSSDYGEIKKYTKREHTAEFRLKISYDLFVSVGDLEQTKLVAASVLRAVRLLPELKIENFDFAAFEVEVIDLFRQMGWI